MSFRSQRPPPGVAAQEWIGPSLFEAALGQLESLRARNASRSDAGRGSNPVSRTIISRRSRTGRFRSVVPILRPSGLCPLTPSHAVVFSESRDFLDE